MGDPWFEFDSERGVMRQFDAGGRLVAENERPTVPLDDDGRAYGIKAALDVWSVDAVAGGGERLRYHLRIDPRCLSIQATMEFTRPELRHVDDCNCGRPPLGPRAGL